MKSNKTKQVQVQQKKQVQVQQKEPALETSVAGFLDRRLKHYMERIQPYTVGGAFLTVFAQGLGWLSLPVSVVNTLILTVLAPTTLLTGLAAVVLAWKWGKSAG